MTRRLCPLAILLLTTTATIAAELTPDEVRAAVTTWVRSVTADAVADAAIVQLDPYVVGGRTCAYVVYLSSGGFALSGADDRLLPVYLYCPREPYDPADPINADILGEVAGRLARIDDAARISDSVLQQAAPVLAARAAQWRDLQAGIVPPAARGRAVPTLMTLPITDQWHQGGPYNTNCPVLTPGSDERAVTGCVATAMSEIMYYWKWPALGTGSGSAVHYRRYSDTWLSTSLAVGPEVPSGWEGGARLAYDDTTHELRMRGYWDYSLTESARHLLLDPNGDPDPAYAEAVMTLYDRLTEDTQNYSLNFGLVSFDWNAIQDAHALPYGAEDAAVAYLCYSAGIACSMGYGYKSSATDTSHAANAYSDHFYYDPDALYVTRDTSTMMEEIRWLRPVQMSGQSDAGGHSFVACGYNSDVDPPQFLINKGWGGGATAGLPVDDFFPNDAHHVIYIAPQSIVRFVGGVYGGDGSPAQPYVNLTTALSSTPDNTTLIMKAGSSHAVSTAAAKISRPLILMGHQVTITRE